MKLLYTLYYIIVPVPKKQLEDELQSCYDRVKQIVAKLESGEQFPGKPELMVEIKQKLRRTEKELTRIKELTAIG
jgi:hypothetical protein